MSSIGPCGTHLCRAPFIETAVLMALSHVFPYMPMPQRTAALAAAYEQSGRGIVLMIYVPIRIMVLRQPTEGSLPQRLDRANSALRDSIGRLQTRRRGQFSSREVRSRCVVVDLGES